jgi:hypothetical protein
MSSKDEYDQLPKLPKTPAHATTDLVVSATVAGLPLLYYAAVLMNLDFEDKTWTVALLPAAFLVSWVVLHWCYGKQTLKTYARYAEDMRENRGSVPKGKGVPSDEVRSATLWNHATSYSYTVTNLLYVFVFLFLHFKVLVDSIVPIEL